MNKHVRKQALSLLMVCAGGIVSTAQSNTSAASHVFDKRWIKNGKYEMSCFVMSDNRNVEFSSFAIEINSGEKNFSVYTTLTLFGQSPDQWVDTSVSDPNTFKPIYRSSYNRNREYRLRYGKEVTGYYIDKQTNKRSTVKDAVKQVFYDSYTYPYLLGLLPLEPGYKTELPVYEYKPTNAENVKKARIEEVRSGMYTSPVTGDHKVWQVTVIEEATNGRYEYFIDKDSRRIWRINIQSNGLYYTMTDKELDYNPFKSTFNKEETLRLINSGAGVINGEVFARDNENEGMLKGMAILNINKKQYAKQGTSILLIPYTDFFKEWIKLNESLRKKGKAVPLPGDAAGCIKVTTVYDDKGNFEFVNLMPGEYLLYSEFGYVHTSRRTEVVGYTDTYINGMFQGSTANTQTYSYNTNARATVKKVVTVKKEGEKVSVKLKQTL